MSRIDQLVLYLDHFHLTHLPAPLRPKKYREWTQPEFGFVDGATDHLVQRKTNQLWRNLLLVIATRHGQQNYTAGHVVVIAPADDQGATDALTGVQTQLVKPKDLVRELSLESIVKTAAKHKELSEWSQRFTARYLVV